MILFPNAKLNLGLQIVGKRADGYHLLDTFFYPIPLRDVLEIRASEVAEDRLFLSGGIEVGQESDNLVLKAVRLLREEGYSFPAVDCYLHKEIPSGAGMGGGSSNASFTLVGLSREFDLKISPEELERYALRLGADCPFFVRNTPALAGGIGEELRPLGGVNLSGYRLVLIKPELHISTAEAFGGLQDIVGPKPHRVEELIIQPLSHWAGLLQNDFEYSLFPGYPILAQIKSWLYSAGAIYASMTGSGSTLYGLFDRDTQLPSIPFTNSFVWQTIL